MSLKKTRREQATKHAHEAVSRLRILTQAMKAIATPDRITALDAVIARTESPDFDPRRHLETLRDDLAIICGQEPKYDPPDNPSLS